MSNQYQIGVVVGSLRSDSYNKKVANALIKLFPSHFTFKFIDISELPLYNQDADQHVPTTVAQFKSQISQCDGIIFVTPEYNRSIPGVLKNAIDQGSRPWGDNSWNGKPAGILGVSIGNISTAIAQQHLRNSLAFLNMPTLNQPECFLKWFDGMVDEQNNFAQKSKEFIQTWADAYALFVTKNIAK
ncbi:NAD(P)H-dependent oxidoreductase [Providencia stuartii]|uniref:NAD(P)H-dependent oxidoreductase n=2 Tax=Providencia TaxID=586 RepID=A0AAI9GHK1_PROST|nr:MULTISPECIES: NAD(P)H-dependent oxidoreductase [Providencia]MDV5226125.1 NAD(P)H-dependent oxidoreductase [Providencia rettgeri]ELR5040821.1 NAD(P)H-dependent oxidoreductase [Providencia stuartii]ELR5083626.1 NAD(P)H-dependent oxidoreductase [Providencia stuartii]ELR5112315.1 NAD(P)H-dependent oxidoreductase [Providencia stuartii]ELR5302058.1 NAD(P)H-dependent oxidoreductase [Providencia stuartii]